MSHCIPWLSSLCGLQSLVSVFRSAMMVSMHSCEEIKRTLLRMLLVCDHKQYCQLPLSIVDQNLMFITLVLLSGIQNPRHRVGQSRQSSRPASERTASNAPSGSLMSHTSDVRSAPSASSSKVSKTGSRPSSHNSNARTSSKMSNTSQPSQQEGQGPSSRPTSRSESQMSKQTQSRASSRVSSCRQSPREDLSSRTVSVKSTNSTPIVSPRLDERGEARL